MQSFQLKSVHIFSALITTLFISCQSDTPNLSKAPAEKGLPKSLADKVKAKKGSLSNVKQAPFGDLYLHKQALDEKFKGKKLSTINKFGLQQSNNVTCTGNECYYQEVGDWPRYRLWEDFYADVYNDPKYANFIYGFISPYSSNNNGDQLCAYETRSYCSSDGSCTVQNEELTLYGCICPQQYNQSPPNYVEDPATCANYNHLLPDTSEEACNAMWDKVNSCYNAGGFPHYDYSICRFDRCEGVDEGSGGGDINQFCQTYTVNGSEKESCVSCGDAGEMLYKNGHVSSCAPNYVSDNKTAFFQILSSTDTSPDAPYTQYFNSNNACQ